MTASDSLPTTPDTPRSGGFATTSWSLVAVAGGDETPQSRQALETLCRAYWRPLHAYVRRRVADVHEAQDLTQGFFTRLLERNDFAAVRADRGRFRAWLLTALKHHMINEGHKARAQKRGGGRVPLSLDFDGHDSGLRWEPGDPTTPEQVYEREWASTVLASVFEHLRRESQGQPDGDSDRARRFELLTPFLAGTMPRGAYAGAAEQLGISEGAARMAVQRLRERYRELLRSEIAQTVRDPAEVDDEIAALFAAVRASPRIL